MIVSAEVPHLRLRDKVLTVSYIASFIIEFGVSFSLPYLLYAPYANLESRVGFIYGGVAVLGLIWSYFYLPETTGRSLEEMEELWQENVPPRQFALYHTKTNGVGSRVSKLEAHAGAGMPSDSSEEDLGRIMSNPLSHSDSKGGTVVYHETIEPKK